MKKFFALLLSAILLLSACACAEADVPVTHSHRLSDLYIFAGDQVIDLSGIAFELDISAEDGKPIAGSLHLDVDGETIAEVGNTMVDGLWVYHLESSTLGHKDFVIDPVVFLSQYLDQGISAIITILQSLDTTQLAQTIIDGFSQAYVAPAEESAEPAPSTPEISVEGDIVNAMLAHVSEPHTVDMGGVEYGTDGTQTNIADGTYTAVDIDFDAESIYEILNMIYVDGEPGGLGDQLREAGVAPSLFGTIISGDAEGLNELVSLSLQWDYEDQSFVLGVGSNKSYNETGSTTAFSMGAAMGEDAFGCTFNTALTQHDGEVFSSDEIDMDNAIMLTDVNELDEFNEAIGTVASDAMAALIMPLMAGVDLSALTEAAPAE